jgi:hypothetical protein
MIEENQGDRMEEYTGEFAALETRRAAALEKLKNTSDAVEIKRLQDELREIDLATKELGEEDE